MFADLQRIADVLEKLPDGKLAIAFSGGVDSMTLARAAEMILGKENVLLLFADSVFAPSAEKNFALEWAKARQLRCLQVPFEPLSDPLIAANDLKKCYFCKKALFTTLLDYAAQAGFFTVADGENLDDAADYRPGRTAADELHIRHIFVEANLDKAAIRDLAHDLALSNAYAPASACLASRIPCGNPITPEKLAAVDQAENILCKLGFAASRVRHCGDLAKIEVAPQELEKLFSMREIILEKFKTLPFKSVALDLAGYRRGAVNGTDQGKI